MKTTISNTTHEFRLAEVDNDGLSLYLSVLNGPDRVDIIAAKHLRQKVIDHSLQSKDINDASFLSNTECSTRKEDYDKIKQGPLVSDEQALKTLAFLYLNNLFYVISKIPAGEKKYHINIDKYVKGISSYKKCVFILYDGIAHRYSPLYLYNKNNEEEEKSNFKHYDETMKNLLRKFIRKELEYDGYVNLEDANTINEPVMKLAEADDINSLIVDIDITDTKNFSEDDVKSFNDFLQQLRSPISNTNEENFLSSETLINVFETTHEFVQEPVGGDGHCLFSSLQILLPNWQGNTIEISRKQVADYILQWADIDDAVLLYDINTNPNRNQTGTRTQIRNREEYCKAIEETDEWGGEPEIQAISKLSNIAICVVNVNKVNGITQPVNVMESSEPSFEKCVYIIHVQNNHYEPLYLLDQNNPNDKITTFNRNDQMVKELLLKFLQKKHNYYGELKWFAINSSRHELEPHVTFLNKSVNVFDLIVMNPKKNLSKKRKAPEDDESSFMVDTKTKLPLTITRTNTVNQSSKYSRSLPTADVIHKLDNQKDTPLDIARLLQTDFSAECHIISNPPVEQQQIAASSIAELTNIMPIDNRQEEKMKLEIEPMKKFHGRYRHDYKPKKALNRKGKPSEVRLPSYFADRRDNHWLNLLIPETYLFGNSNGIFVEICIVTKDINGCIYINPYFKFQVNNKDRNSPDLNPRFIFLLKDELKTWSQGMRNILHYLVVIKLTENELIENQPIKTFQPLKSSGQAVTRKYESVDDFKQAYCLNEIRFAFTLWLEESRKKGFYRDVKMQYISEISKEDPNMKVRDNIE